MDHNSPEIDYTLQSGFCFQQKCQDNSMEKEVFCTSGVKHLDPKFAAYTEINSE